MSSTLPTPTPPMRLSNVALKPSALTTDQYRLVEAPSEDFVVDVVRNCQIAASRQKRVRDGTQVDEAEGEQKLKTYALKATPQGAAIVTSAGETFGLRRVAYSNSLFLTDVDGVATLPKTGTPPPTPNKENTSLGDATPSPADPAGIMGQERIPALFECARRPPKFDITHRYLASTALSLEELETGLDNTPVANLKTWGELFSENIASAQEIRNYLAYRNALVYKGHIRCICPSVIDDVITAILTQVEARGTARPWEDVPFDLFLTPATSTDTGVRTLTTDLGYPVEAVVSALRILGASLSDMTPQSYTPLRSGSTGTFALDQDHVVAVVGQVTLRKNDLKNPGHTNLKKELLLLWQRAVPNGMQPLCDLEKLVNNFDTITQTTVHKLKPGLSTISPGEGILCVDVNALSYDPRERIRQLFGLTPRILAIELRSFLLPLFHVSAGSDDVPMPKTFMEMDNILGRSCREHKGKGGHFFSME